MTTIIKNLLLWMNTEQKSHTYQPTDIFMHSNENNSTIIGNYVRKIFHKRLHEKCM